jgi:hypothetical protein
MGEDESASKVFSSPASVWEGWWFGGAIVLAMFGAVVEGRVEIL